MDTQAIGVNGRRTTQKNTQPITKHFGKLIMLLNITDHGMLKNVTSLKDVDLTLQEEVKNTCLGQT